jgi:NhaP-type Na+/H+ or K+/H+ antiporter
VTPPFADAAPGISPLGTIPEVLLLVSLAAIGAIGALSHERERHFSASLVYLAMGALGALLLRPLGIDPFRLLTEDETVEILTDVAIAVAVFATGLRLRRAPPRRRRTVALLLLVTMPLTVAGVALFATLALGLPLGAAIVLGAALAPTDPVLAGDIGLGPPGSAEDQPRARGLLSAEAGANDGAGLPLLVLGLMLAAGDDGAADLAQWLAADVLFAVGVAAAWGVAAGWGFAAAFHAMRHRDLLDSGYEAWAAVAAALLLYAVAELAGAYGFVAAFAGGLAFRRHEYESDANRAFHDGAGDAETVLELAVLLLLGSALTTAGLAEPGLAGWLLAPLLLLAIRPLAALAALVGSGIAPRERLYVAWFGVKGIATLNYAVIAAASGALGGDASVVLWTAIVCVIVSIVAHGTTATAVTRRLLPD